MATPVGPTGWEPPAWYPKATGAPEANGMVNKEMFLKLLVAQIRHQNPLNPADGIEFISQLAQFTSLEQMIGMRQELETIRKSIQPVPTEMGDVMPTD
jgi:flagellar basal-body rod modification protein FlgD